MQNQRIRLEELTEVITKGTTPTTLGKDFAVNGIRFLRVQNLNDGKLLFSEDDLFIDQETDQLLKRSRIQSGDILLSIAGTIGRSAIVPLDCSLLNCNQAVAILRPNKKVFAPYLRFWLDSLDAQKQMMGAKVTGTISNLSLTQIRNLEIALPPLTEQKRIARILDVAAAVQAQRRATLTHLDTLLQSTFLHLFGDPVDNPLHWRCHPIAKMGLFISDGNYAEKYPRQDDFVESGIPFIRANNLKNNTVVWDDMRYITPEKHNYLQKGHVKTKDILITTRGNIGQVGLVPDSFDDANINAQLVLMRIIEPHVTPEYLLWALNSTSMQREIVKNQTGTALKQLPVGRLKNIKVPVPPIELQTRFSFIIEHYSKLLDRHLAALKQAELLFQSLQQRAFRGQLSPA